MAFCGLYVGILTSPLTLMYLPVTKVLKNIGTLIVMDNGCVSNSNLSKHIIQYRFLSTETLCE